MSDSGRRTPRSDRDRDRDRGHHRRRDDRERDRDRERARSSERVVEPKFAIKAILKRPAVHQASASQGQSSSGSRGHTPTPTSSSTSTSGSQQKSGEKGKLILGEEHFPKLGEKPSGAQPPVQIQVKPRPSEVTQPEASGDSSAAPPPGEKEATKVLPTPPPPPKVSTCFKEGRAIPLVSNMKLRSESSLDFIPANGDLKDFFVISIVGPPLAGKSTILSYLSAGEELVSFGEHQIFPNRGSGDSLNCSIYMNSEKTIFIEMAPVFNGSAAYELISHGSTFGTLETSTTTLNLKMMRLALSISHVVLLVSDTLIDPNLFQLVNSARIISQLESSFGEGEHAEVLFICNKMSRLQSDGERIGELFEESQKLFANVVGTTPRIVPNLFILPHFRQSDSQQMTTSKAKYEEFKGAINEFILYNRAPFIGERGGRRKFGQRVTLKEWWNSLQARWDEMAQLGFFSSYAKLFP